MLINLSPLVCLYLMVLGVCWVQQESEVRYLAAPMFTLHQINAFEDSGFLVMDMCCGDDGEIIGDFTLENLRRKSGEEMDKVNTFNYCPSLMVLNVCVCVGCAWNVPHTKFNETLRK